MIKVGITGQQGFVGQHLFNTLGLFPGDFQIIPFKRDVFEDIQQLSDFVSKCDVIVHLAAKNRHNDPEVVFNTNLSLNRKLVEALDKSGTTPHVIFSSSSQEEKDNPYGKSKNEGRQILASWAKRAGAKFSGLIIPNVFGSFGNPFYNSFIATFCHLLTHGGKPVIDVDSVVKLIYVADLVEEIIDIIRKSQVGDAMEILYRDEYKVSSILELLESYRDQYYELGIIPEIRSTFELNLFNTFRSYIDAGAHYPVKFKKHVDDRGEFVEIIRLNVGGQCSFSTTVPGITRGNHFHTRKVERFAVIRGKALIQMRKIGTGEVLNFYLDGSEPAYVDMPIWYTHNITNIGDEELYTNFWINEFFDPNDPDTYMEVV